MSDNYDRYYYLRFSTVKTPLRFKSLTELLQTNLYLGFLADEGHQTENHTTVLAFHQRIISYLPGLKTKLPIQVLAI